MCRRKMKILELAVPEESFEA